MHDSRAKNSFHDRATASPRGQRQSHAENSFPPPEIRPSEAELLRAIGRLLDEQRAKARQTEPLVDRIETILGSRLQAANDIASAPEPARPVPAPRPQLTEVHHVAPVEKASVPTVPRKGRRPNWVGSAAVVAALSSGGAVVPILMPVSPALYTAETTLVVDAGAGNRAVLVGDTARRLSSAPVIASAVAALKLDRDPEFAGNNANALGVAFDLLSGSGAAADPASRAEAALKSAVAVVPDDRAGTIRLMVTTGDANKSTRIATRLSDAVTGGSATGKAAETAAALKRENDQAQADLAAFSQKNGEGNVKVATQLQHQIAGLDADLKKADENILAAKAQADKLKAAKLADVLEGSLLPDMISPALQDLRDRYAIAKTALAQLSADLGPRHPRLLQQQSEVDGLKDSIGKELARLAQNANAAAKAAVDARRQLSDRRNALIAQSRDTGVDLARLTELREKASAARSRLEEEVSTTGAIGDGRVTVARPALLLPASGDNNLGFSALLGGLAGLALGLGLAFLPRLFRRQPERAQVPAPFRAPEPEHAQATALARAPQPAPVPQAAGEVDALRSQIASLRDRFHAYKASQ
ncbi:succinoglycan biosynthesis protein exop [Rhizobium sp. KDH_Rht_773_N]